MVHDGMVYPSGLAHSARNLAYSVCNASILASICHLYQPRQLGKRAYMGFVAQHSARQR